MKHTILLFLSLIICFNTASAQNSLFETEKLAATAKVWGFLKYYHPNVASGKLDWDDQLLTILPSVEKAGTKEELSGIYLRWIESLGAIKPCKKCQTSSETAHFDKNFDLTWFENNEVFTKELTEKLKYIEQSRFQGKPFYVATSGRNSGLVLTNEKSYDNFDWTNRPLRLLSLFRYWNTIAYFYPHKYQLDTEWDIVLSQMLPKFSSTDSESAYHLAMLELVVKIDDSHGYFTSKPIQEHFGVKQIPAAFRIIDDEVVITRIYDDSLARLSDIKTGDVISKVEGIDVAEVLKQNLKYIYGANYNTKLKYAFNKILNGSSDSVTVEITRGGETKVRKLARYPFDQFNHSPNKRTWEIMAGNIGYLNLGTIDGKALTNAFNSLAGTQAIIIDLRNYPNAFYGYHFKNFLGAKNEVVVRQIKPDFKYPGKYILSDQEKIPKTESKYKGKVVLLVDEYTQSRAEYTAVWIQNGYNVTTVGSQTAGAGGLMIPQEFVGGYTSYFTSSGIFYPDMSPIQRKGVKIDIEVKPTVQGIIDGKDEVLEKAIEFVNGNA
ncbi:C-terminal processing protease CtpA/Prc [Pontibacter mucosus]|uniref:C-terminal processing protease CtpA/Prc n=1 Tax=Pontibacter mucosus TaxID=1649266 RepID=A0A2T5YP32_9BACT|nr:S41 family peptidase [Pontibacter mucosus]PTX21068.1 C-terminal processing protease CtpA/Prc [Pontibacter mucosus]